jgi:hypothetical protein
VYTCQQRGYDRPRVPFNELTRPGNGAGMRVAGGTLGGVQKAAGVAPQGIGTREARVNRCTKWPVPLFTGRITDLAGLERTSVCPPLSTENADTTE